VSHRPPRPRVLPPELRTRAVADLMMMRSIVGFLGSWQYCERACKRQRGCANPNVACFDRNRERIRDYLERLADWPRLDGPREPDVAAGPIGDILD
jgi:hypothetical protein